MDNSNAECCPSESPLYGGHKISMLIASANCSHILFDSGHFYLVYEGSEEKHVTKISTVTYQQVKKLISFSAITPSHRKSEAVKVSLYKLQQNQELVLVGVASHVFIYDGIYQIAQYMLECHLKEQVHQLMENDLENIFNIKLFNLNGNERSNLDKFLTKAFKNLIKEAKTFSLLSQTSLQGVRAQDTLLHFACRHGMPNLIKFLLQYPGGVECLTTPDTDGQLPVDVAQNAGHVDLVNALLRNDLGNTEHEDLPVLSSETQCVTKSLEHEVTELNRLMNIQIDHIEVSPGLNRSIGDKPKYQSHEGFPDDSSASLSDNANCPKKKHNDNDTVTASNEGYSNAKYIKNSSNENGSTAFKSAAVTKAPTENNTHNKILEGNILRLQKLQDEIHLIRSNNSKLQVELCEDQSLQPSQSLPLLNTCDTNMDKEETDGSELTSDCDLTTFTGSYDSKAVKIRVNDVTPSGSQELLCSKSTVTDDQQQQQHKDNVDGFYGNTKKQLEMRNKRVQKETRRQSWSGDNKVKGNSTQGKSQFMYSSVSSMDSDTDETFFDAQDSALCDKSDALKPKRPNSVSDIDIAGELDSISNNEYNCNSSPSSLSLQCLYDSDINQEKEPKTTDDICSKSLSEHQISKMLNAPLGPPRSLLKSISTPSIIAVNDAKENWTENSITMDDSQTSIISRKQVIADASPNHDSDDDKPFKRKKRSSIFFKKKWGKDKDLKKSNHQYVAVNSSNLSQCDVCAKSLSNKPALHCETCMVKVHDSTCKDHISDCIKSKNSKVVSKSASYNYSSSANKEKLTTSTSFKTTSSGSIFSSSSPHQTRSKKSSDISLSISTVQETGSSNAQKSSGNSPSKVINEDKEVDMLDDNHSNILETNSASVESLEDGSGDDSDVDDDSDLRLRIEEPEQWSALVDKKFTKKMKDKDVKRQESIYELILTEKHHVLTLRVMQKIYSNGLKKETGISNDVIDRILPSLDILYEIHSSFLRLLRERQKEYTVIPTIGDLLLQRFKGEKACELVNAYGEFCSRHQEAVSLYKDFLKSNRKFQLFIKKSSMNPLCKGRAIPECMLLVTQRITKYPLVIDSLIKSTKENEEEKSNLIEASSLVKNVITKVDGKVTEKQMELRLIEIYNKVDAKSTAFFMGKKFKKSDLLSGKRKLLHEGILMWKNARGKPLEVITVVLSDIIIFLQESNQKYTFVSQDNKSGILSIQKLLVREKAGQDNKGIYLISSNPNDPEMYELGCSSNKEKKMFIENIRHAVENYPDEEDLSLHDLNVNRKLIDVKVARIKHLLASLHEKDMCIAQICEDKMAILLELIESDVKSDLNLDKKYSQFLESRSDPTETRNLLMASLNEASRIASSLYMTGSNLSRSVSSVGEHQSETFISPALPKRAETFGGFDSPTKEQTTLHRTLKKKLIILKENEKIKGSSVSCTVSPVSEEGSDHLHPGSANDVRRLSGPPAISENRGPTNMNKNLSGSTLTNLPLTRINKPKSADESVDISTCNSPSVIDDSVSQSDAVGEILSLNAVTPSLLMAGKDQLTSTIQLTHHLNRLQCLFSQHFTSYEILKTEYAQLKSKQDMFDKEPSNPDLKEKRSLYKHNQRLEELRNLQEQLQKERHALNSENKKLEFRESELDKFQSQIRDEENDVKEQREKLYKQLEVLKRQGILLSPNMQIVNTSLPISPDNNSSKTAPQPDNPSSWEMRATKCDPTARKITLAQLPDQRSNNVQDQKARNTGSACSTPLNKRADVSERQTLPVHLCSATNQQKSIQNPVVLQPSSVKQQLPMKLASLSMGPQGIMNEMLPNSPSPPWNSSNTNQNDSPQFLPMKLATEIGRHGKSNPMRTSSFGGSRAASGNPSCVHQRAGSSPAKMHNEQNPKIRNPASPKEKSEKKDANKKYNESKEQEIIFF